MANNYFEEISLSRQILQRNLLKAFGFEGKDTFQKASLDSIICERTFTIGKRGREIKEKLSELLQRKSTEISQCTIKAESLKSQIGVEPDQEAGVDCYQLEDYPSIASSVPKTYSWGQRQQSTPAPFIVSESEDTPSTQMMWDYNEIVRVLVRLKVDAVLIGTMLSNFEDSKVYELTVKEASTLGF
jgi:hypothetical protein